MATVFLLMRELLNKIGIFSKAWYYNILNKDNPVDKIWVSIVFAIIGISYLASLEINSYLFLIVSYTLFFIGTFVLIVIFYYIFSGFVAKSFVEKVNAYQNTSESIKESDIENFKTVAKLKKDIRHLHLVNLNLSKLHLYSCYFRRTNFEGSNLSEGSYRYCQFIVSNFKNANLTNVDFRNSLIDTDTIFDGADLTNVNLDGVILSHFWEPEYTLKNYEDFLANSYGSYIPDGKEAIYAADYEKYKNLSNWFNYLEKCGAKGTKILNEKYEIINIGNVHKQSGDMQDWAYGYNSDRNHCFLIKLK